MLFWNVFLLLPWQVYDLSTFAEQHPGGTVIDTYFGRDATDVFSTFHASTTWKLLQEFYIGDLVVSCLLRTVHRNFSWKFLCAAKAFCFCLVLVSSFYWPCHVSNEYEFDGRSFSSFDKHCPGMIPSWWRLFVNAAEGGADFGTAEGLQRVESPLPERTAFQEFQILLPFQDSHKCCHCCHKHFDYQSVQVLLGGYVISQFDGLVCSTVRMVISRFSTPSGLTRFPHVVMGLKLPLVPSLSPVRDMRISADPYQARNGCFFTGRRSACRSLSHL